jgi:peptidoglycan/LPS O-acetylase OafA/YrhL
MPLPGFPALYLLFPIVLGVHNLDECAQAERLPASRRLAYSRYFLGRVARMAMVLLTAAAAIVAVLDYATPLVPLATIAKLSVFALLFNAVGHIALSIRYRAWRPGTRSAVFLVLPYTVAVIAIVAHNSGRTVLALWPLAVGGLIGLPAVVLIALALAKGADKLISSH